MLGLEIPSLLDVHSSATAEHRSDVAHTKRFLERWTADPEFRAALPLDPIAVAAAADLKADPLAIRALWDLDPEGRQVSTLSVQRYRAFMAEKVAYRDGLQKNVKSPQRGFQAWRERQVRRAYGELGQSKGDSLVHAALAVELTAGCSVGCWFCGISALKFQGVWPYSEENRTLWLGVLAELQAQLGAAAGRGFCYWATDPLDNPEYEKFCSDFADALGTYPQTTTAQPVRDPERFRSIHKVARQRGNEIDRFSVLSLGMLKKVFAEYTPEELLFVELVMQMDGAWSGKAYAGRARSKPERWKKSTGREIPQDAGTSTIACVSGILLRMPERSFELITPCRADSEWPNGYQVLTRRTFDDVSSFRSELQDVLKKLTERLPLDRKVELRPDLKLEPAEDGFAVVGDFFRQTFRSPVYKSLNELAPFLARGQNSAMELALAVEPTSSLQETLVFLNLIFSLGLLKEEL